MKIVIDLQGAQSNSRHRGIGRYTLSMAKAFAAVSTSHDIWLALNARQSDAAHDLLAHFDGLIPRDRIMAYELPLNIAGCSLHNEPAQRIAEATKASFLSRLDADFIWHSSMFEGWGDESTAALGDGGDDARHVATLYDLIPLLHPDRYLRDNAYRHWYYRRLGLLKRCGLLLAISDSSRQEALSELGVDADRVVVVSAAADPVFKPTPASDADWNHWQGELGMRRSYVLYAGGYDAHKNVDVLVEAYADLPGDLRSRHQLVLAGRCDPQAQQALRTHARKHGLSEGSIVFTGTVDDAELAALYSSCELFVAPSLHEGFGLPALEAMACGAAVIGSNTASLPEVIGLRSALFNPRSCSDMTSRLNDALSNPNWRAQLREHGSAQARRFSWEHSAKRALAAIEAQATRAHLRTRRPRLIYVSPLPPARSGIADYSARLLRDLATHYEIEVVADQATVTDAWALANFPIRSVAWLRAQSVSQVRVLYHMGNSPLHAQMFALLKQHPGMVMLHDSNLAALRNWMATQHPGGQNFSNLLYEFHGIPALHFDHAQGRDATLDMYPISLDVIERALGVIVHSAHAMDLACKHYGTRALEKFVQVPFPKDVTSGNRDVARQLLGIRRDDYVVCSFGMLAPTKLNHRLVTAWLHSSLASDQHCHLIFVGENHGGDYGEQLRNLINASACRGRIHITGFVDAVRYTDFLSAADAAVQLRASSRGETSAAIFDVLAQGLPGIFNRHGSAAEIPAHVALRIDDDFTENELVDALQRLRNERALREQLGAKAKAWIEAEHRPARVANEYRAAIESFLDKSPHMHDQCLLGRLGHQAKTAEEVIPLQDAAWHALQRNQPRLDRPRLFVDVTATSDSLLHTGIERVVRGVLGQLLVDNDSPWRVEPVKLAQGRYVYASAYALHVLDCPKVDLGEAEVEPRTGDMLLGLDWVADALPRANQLLDNWRMRGVRMFFVVYDLLPVRRPEWFPTQIEPMHAQWLACIGRHADGLLGISQSVVADLRNWFQQHPPARSIELPLGYFYPGNDMAATRPTMGLPSDAPKLLAQLRKQPSFLMVGTVEPRKGHALVLDAFERLWSRNISVVLVVVGREGWMSAALAARMRTLAQNERRFVWLDRVSDEYLEQLYTQAKALIAASEGEGFGLPLVESARRGVPVIARDIPVFREVSSNFATYFDGADVAHLVAALEQTLDAPPPCEAIHAESVLSWHTTTCTLCDMLGDMRHSQWLAPWVPQTAISGQSSASRIDI